MSARFYLTLTDYGASLIAKAHGVATITLKDMVVGDANNQPYDPIAHKSRTTLVNQRSSIPIQTIQPINTEIRVSATIPGNIGGFNIHEYGYTDSTGKLVYIGNYHGVYKPLIAEGAGGEIEIISDIKADAGAEVIVLVDPTVVTASKEWVLEQLEKLQTQIYNRHDIDVDDLFITTKRFKSAAEVAQHKGYGTWQRFGDGHALVTSARDNDTATGSWMLTTKSTGGNNSVTLSVDNAPDHNHQFVDTWAGTDNFPEDAERIGSAYGHANDDVTDSLIKRTTSSVGKGEPFSVMQSSIIIDAWLRIS